MALVAVMQGRQEIIAHVLYQQYFVPYKKRQRALPILGGWYIGCDITMLCAQLVHNPHVLRSGMSKPILSNVERLSSHADIQSALLKCPLLTFFLIDLVTDRQYKILFILYILGVCFVGLSNVKVHVSTPTGKFLAASA